MKKIAPPVLLHTRPFIHAASRSTRLPESCFLAGAAILVCWAESEEWVGAGLPSRISGRCGEADDRIDVPRGG